MVTKVSTHSPMLDEILSEVNDAPDVLTALKQALKISYVKEYLSAAVSDEWCTIDLSQIQFKQYDYHRSMAGAMLLNRHTVNIFTQVIMKPSVSAHAKKVQFKALSEMLHSGEQKILLAIVMKNLPELYPNITFELINESLGNEQIA